MFGPAPQGERGFALLSAIIGLGILLVLVSSLVTISQFGLARSYSDLARSRAEAFSDAILLRVVLALQNANLQDRPRVDGVQSVIDVLGTPVPVTIEDEFGKVDMNAASTALLSKLFQASGLSAVKADELAQQVEIWREGDPSSAAAGQNIERLPDRRRFRLTNELLLVSGIDRQTFLALEPALTVYSGQDRVDQAVAPYLALMASLGISAERARQMVDQRSTDTSPVVLSNIRGGRILPGTDQRGWPFRIRSEFVVDSGRYCLDAVFRLTGAAGNGLVIMRRSFTEGGCE